MYADLIDVQLNQLTVDTSFACSGGFIFSKDSPAVRVDAIDATRLVTHSGAFGAFSAVAVVLLSQFVLTHSNAEQAGGHARIAAPAGRLCELCVGVAPPLLADLLALLCCVVQAVLF